MYRTAESAYCTPEVNITLSVDYTGIKYRYKWNYFFKVDIAEIKWETQRKKKSKSRGKGQRDEIKQKLRQRSYLKSWGPRERNQNRKTNHHDALSSKTEPLMKLGGESLDNCWQFFCNIYFSFNSSNIYMYSIKFGESGRECEGQKDSVWERQKDRYTYKEWERERTKKIEGEEGEKTCGVITYHHRHHHERIMLKFVAPLLEIELWMNSAS